MDEEKSRSECGQGVRTGLSGEVTSRLRPEILFADAEEQGRVTSAPSKALPGCPALTQASQGWGLRESPLLKVPLGVALYTPPCTPQADRGLPQPNCRVPLPTTDGPLGPITPPLHPRLDPRSHPGPLPKPHQRLSWEAGQ